MTKKTNAKPTKSQRMAANPSGPLGRPRAKGSSAATSKKTTTRADGRKQLVEVPAKPVNRDEITTVKNDNSNAFVCVMAGDQPVLTYERNRETSVLRKLAVVGGSYKAVKAEIAKLPPKEAKLANGLDSKNAPQSAKAAADSRKAAAKAEPAKPAAKPAKGKTDRTAKADKNKQPSKGADRSYVKGTRKDESKPDTFRRYMLTTILAHKSTAAAKAAHAKSGKYPTHKLDFNWAAQQGYIKFTDK